MQLLEQKLGPTVLPWLLSLVDEINNHIADDKRHREFVVEKEAFRKKVEGKFAIGPSQEGEVVTTSVEPPSYSVNPPEDKDAGKATESTDENTRFPRAEPGERSS